MTNKSLLARYEEFKELDAIRTQGIWQLSYGLLAPPFPYELSIYDSKHQPLNGGKPLANFCEFGIRAKATKEDADFIASAPALFRLLTIAMEDSAKLRECLESVWYSEFRNNETCMEGEQIKKVLIETSPDREIEL